MFADRIIRRYAAFFRGWAQAFGEHEKIESPSQGLRWLVGEEQIGLILVPAIKRFGSRSSWDIRPASHPRSFCIGTRSRSPRFALGSDRRLALRSPAFSPYWADAAICISIRPII
jgi:hypothetical protein